MARRSAPVPEEPKQEQPPPEDQTSDQKPEEPDHQDQQPEPQAPEDVPTSPAPEEPAWVPPAEVMVRATKECYWEGLRKVGAEFSVPWSRRKSTAWVVIDKAAILPTGEPTGEPNTFSQMTKIQAQGGRLGGVQI